MASEWILKEDGYLNVVDCNSRKIIYHPNLNVILIFDENFLKVLDVNSGALLQSCCVTAGRNKIVRGKYLSEQDKILLWNDEKLGLRGDYNGVLLLDTILQTPTSQTDDLVKIELLMSEAVLFLQSLQSLEQQGVESSSDVINELTLKINEAHQKAKKGIKAQKWETVCLELPHSSLKVVASSMVIELKRLQRHIPALAIASAVNERLTDLIVGARIIENDNTQRFHMFSEAARRKTFDQWPHMDYKWALPDQMAQAGFYHQPSDSGDDRAMCFTCNVCLVCWEKTDEPWSEHERHSPDCPFVKGEYTQNVPLSITYASNPAVLIDDFSIISSGDQGSIICVGSPVSGDIKIWNVERQLKNSATMNIKSAEKEVMKKFEVENEVKISLSALSIFKKHTILSKGSTTSKNAKTGIDNKFSEVIGTRIIAGVNVDCSVSEGNIQQISENHLALILFAVTEVAKSTLKSTTVIANGNSVSPSVIHTKDSLSSLIANSKKTSLSTIEERFEDDFLKFFDNDNYSLPFKLPKKKDDSAAGPKMSLDNGFTEMDAKSSSSSGTTTPKPKEDNDVICTPIQTLPISSCFPKHTIVEILPSYDNQNLLVVLKNITDQESSQNEDVVMKSNSQDEFNSSSSVQLILFAIEDNGFINETPVTSRVLDENETPVEIGMLPKLDNSGRMFSGSPTDSEKGVFVITCMDGSIKILSLTSLKTLTQTKVEDQRFVSTVYCKNLERLCGCTANGSLHFYSFFDLEVDSSDESVDEETVSNDIETENNTASSSKKQKIKTSNDCYAQFDNATPSTSTSFLKSYVDEKRNTEMIAYQKSLSLNDMKTLYSLTLFDEMLTPYSAEVPGCWSELVQAQKQRRHPQNSMRPGDDTHLTRTWRLHNDASTWDEHLIELSLPKTASLGHIDFKFSLYQPCTSPPAIQVTLLKQKSIGLCCRRKTPGGSSSNQNITPENSFDVDENIDFNINATSSGASFSSIENPVLTEEYLQARNAEIMAGPIELKTCMDLNEQGGVVTMVSPKLLKSKARNYLLHIKTMADLSKDGHGKTRVPVRKKGITSVLLTSFAKEPAKERVTYVQDTNSNKSNNDFYIGCDWLHEISITVRATREVTSLPNERLQRLAMLESNLLIKNLLEIASNNQQVLQQNLALDILNWIVSIRLARYRCSKNYFNKFSKNETINDMAATDVMSQQSECVQIIEQSLGEIVKKCILLNNRSVAHKCTKLITVTMIGAQYIMDQNQCYAFEIALKSTLQESIPDMVKSNYAGGLRWFSLLISSTSTADSQGSISSSLMNILIDVLREISNRPSPLNSLLQARFGLYGMPFESELFDLELPSLSNKNSSTSYASLLKPNNAQHSNLSDLKNFCSSEGSEMRVPMQLRRKGISNHFKGLLEVEPIHYVCCSTSEATRIENMDSMSMQSSNIIEDILIESPGQNGVVKLGSMKMPMQMEPKKNETELDKLEIGLTNEMKNVFVDKIFYSQIKKHAKYDQLKSLIKTDVSNVSNIKIFSNEDYNTTFECWGPSQSTDYAVVDATSRGFEEQLFDNNKMTPSSSAMSSKIKEFIDESNRDDNNPIYPWHKLLSTPAKQMIVVDRMHSGARRHVVLDFGYPILLTDFIIPSSADLASLTIDIWSFEEESDSVRLAVSQDIGVKSLILSDLQPPPVCRFLKITFTGRYGMSATRCKIPMGTFYGHVVFLEKETYTDPVMNLVKTKSNQIKTQLNVLNALYEDTHCRYCLSSSKLAELLKPLLRGENSNLSHMQSYLNRFKDMDEQNVEFNRINAVYEECIAFQNQLNVVKNVIKRLQLVMTPELPIPVEVKLGSLSTDKLRVLSENLVETLLHFIVTYGIQNVSMLHSFFDLETCNLLFKTLVINGDSYIQLSTCSLLVRMCCFQPWWGEFFSNIFTTLFSSQNCEIFPQNRVFFLLTYLGRKSIGMGGNCRTTVFDAILKTIAQLLAPLSTNFDNRLGVWRNTDLILLSWLLLFLSVCLDDNSEKKENGNPRWDFMSHEADIVKARLSMNNNSSRNFSRSFKKRFLSSKQQANSNIAEKFLMSEQIASSQLEQAMKHHENSLKKLQTSIKLNTFNEYFHEYNKNVLKKNTENACRSGSSGTSSKIFPNQGAPTSNRGDSSSFESVPGSPFDKGLKSIKTGNMLAVIRGLIGLLLNMDFTCNMDLFLLTCKIVARLVNSCRPSVQLCSIITTSQLLQLIRIAVWENQQHPWTVHAITCLLQEILEADKNFKMMNNSNENVAMEIDPCDIESEVELEENSMQIPMMQSNHMPKESLSYAEDFSAVKYQLPSLMECDDTEMEDILDDILEQAKKVSGLTKKDGAPTPPSRALTVLYRGKVSSTMDARLEYGLDANVEIWLRRQTMKSSLNLFVSLPRIGNNDTIHIANDIPVWSEDILSAWSNSEYQQNMDTNIMLMDVFENIFNDLHLEDSWLNLEQVLQLWLTLNGDMNDTGYSAGRQPKIPFGEKAVYGLLKALASHPNIKIRGWCLGFQCLIFACKPVDSDSEYMHLFGSLENYTKKIGSLIINNENFERMLLRFFSGVDRHGTSANSYAGPTICRLMLELFSCLQTKCSKAKLKEILLNVTLNLIRYDGAISKQQGPIDAQSQLFKELLKFQFVKADLGVAMSLVESVALLVHNHITNTEKINCHKSTESNGNNNNVFGSLFATVLGSDTQSKTVTDTTLLVNLLKLSSILIHIKIPTVGEEGSASNETAANISCINESQTDEIKQQQQHTEPRSRSTPTFCDTVLQHYPTMNKLLAALSHCSNSSFAMLLISSMYTTINSETKNTLSDPQNVSDALFQLLIYLNKLASEPVLIIKPLFDYLNYVSSVRLAMPKLQLSEPFLWFILKILETSTSVEIFCEMGGIKILAENLVRSNRSLINMQPNLVTMIMQHMSKSTHNLAAGAIKKTCSTKNEDGLINFAPYCSITSENPSAQPPDLLIQGPIASHRRARTPAWSYLFYPHESHVDLTMTLPTAVLLKEVQLQPHLSTLASCPSAVAIEITRDNNLGPIPITQPISTVGMTCIRLKLSQPEIATHIIIRLYRPKDSASIGLTQISILGSTIFSDIGSSSKFTSASNGLGNFSGYSSNVDMSIEDDSLTKTSLGWLRILAQCFNVTTFNTDAHNLSNSVITSASDVNGFLEACCSLLNIAPVSPNFSMQNLETVLLKLGLHSRDLGLKLIDILLNESIPQMFKLCNESISDLLYQLCTNADSFSRDRIQLMITWLQNLRKISITNPFISTSKQMINPNSGYIKCLSSILWQAHTTNLIMDLPNLMTQELFDILYKWLLELDENSPTKMAVDAMICSVCCIRPEYFTLLLKKMQVLVPNLATDMSACISDDRKDNESMTDDNKQEEYNIEEWYGHYTIQSLSKLYLTASQLGTIALACQSPLAIHHLIDSGLLNLFTSAILEFCHRMSSKENLMVDDQQTECLTDTDKVNINGGFSMISVSKITEVLEFLSEICSEGSSRDWLSSYEGSVFWEPLLTLLCNNKLQNSFLHDDATNQPYLKLEETVIKFLSNVTVCHPKNQETLTTNLISVIRTTERNNYNININNLLNKNFEGPQQNYVMPSNIKYSISGFTRRLVLQILLESEKIAVSVRSKLPLQKKENTISLLSNHPSKQSNSHHLTFYISINTRCQELLENCVSVFNNLIPSINAEQRPSTSDFTSNTSAETLRERKEKELWELGLGVNLGMEFLSVAAGVTAKDKRLKEVKNQANTLKTKDLFSVFKMRPDDAKNMGNIPDCFSQLVHPSCPDVLLTSDTTIAQILTMVKSAGLSLSCPCITLNLVQSKILPDEVNVLDAEMKASDFIPLQSPLQIFSSRGGLSLLAQYLPTVYPEQPKTQRVPDKDKAPATAGPDWVKLEPNEEIYEDVDDSLADTSLKLPVISSVPQHSLAAFGLFLKLPAYSEVLLRDKVRAQCLLRLILGVTGDGEGNDIYSLALSSSLPTLPFDVFRQLLDNSPLTTDDGVLLRRMVVEVGAIHLILSCLSIFSHHNSNISTIVGTVPAPAPANKSTASPVTVEEQAISDDKSHVYWAKGTGFGTGSTQQSWNVEQALMRQKSEEEHVTVLLQVLSSYINPGDVMPPNNCDTDYHGESGDNISAELPALFLDLMQQSCLLPALCSYLRNDSVLDITRHIPLYRAILQLLRALSLSSQLVHMLIAKQDIDTRTTIAGLLHNMNGIVETYAGRLKINKKSNLKGTSQKILISMDDSDDEGLALLIPDIRETATLVQSVTYTETKEDQQNTCSLEYPLGLSIEQKYLEVMKRLQFDTFEMIAESENGNNCGYRFTISHHFETNVRMSGDRGNPARVKRLAQEAVTLSTSLPLSYSSSVFVRCDTDRLDIMKVLITGPADTPYANGCFEFDVYFPAEYPNAPMLINLETTGRHSVRFNPNLYNDGKVCLSVLNTWHGRPEEKWNAQTSSFLQVLVSIQSLILVNEPYFNEPGFERSRGTPSGTHSSREYNSNIYQASVKWAMLEQLKNPCPCFKDVIHTHFWLKRNEICAQIENWITELSRPQYSELRSGRTISFNSMVLRRQYRQLREELAKLTVPEGLEDLDTPFSATTPSPSTSIINQAAGTSQLATSIDEINATTELLDSDISAKNDDMFVPMDEVQLQNHLDPLEESSFLQLNAFDTLLDNFGVLEAQKNIEDMLHEGDEH